MKYFTVTHAVDYNSGRAVIGKCRIEATDPGKITVKKSLSETKKVTGRR